MRIGLVTDIHNNADALSRALTALEARGIDLLVTLGDTCDVFFPEGGIVGGGDDVAGAARSRGLGQP
jgi:Icc-related predicted phosphoesterase